jgi:SEC-C motif-containing protein
MPTVQGPVRSRTIRAVKVQPNAPCPCGSGTKLKRCCRPFHRGAVPPSPEALMRSRYCAYATGEAEYILDTTDPEGPLWKSEREAWLRDVRAFCASTEFQGLEVLAVEGGEGVGFVTFRARLRQGGKDASFSERSRFVRREGRWLYHSGQTQ